MPAWRDGSKEDIIGQALQASPYARRERAQSAEPSPSKTKDRYVGYSGYLDPYYPRGHPPPNNYYMYAQAPHPGYSHYPPPPFQGYGPYVQDNVYRDDRQRYVTPRTPPRLTHQDRGPVDPTSPIAHRRQELSAVRENEELQTIVEPSTPAQRNVGKISGSSLGHNENVGDIAGKNSGDIISEAALATSCALEDAGDDLAPQSEPNDKQNNGIEPGDERGISDEAMKERDSGTKEQVGTLQEGVEQNEQSPRKRSKKSEEEDIAERLPIIGAAVKRVADEAGSTPERVMEVYNKLESNLKGTRDSAWGYYQSLFYAPKYHEAQVAMTRKHLKMKPGKYL